jgi:branched-chain amino acid transport system substrate-binding protein
MLQEAIRRVGLDREAVSAELSGGTFQTVLGETKLQDNRLRDLWLVGQWQDGQLVGVAPADRPGASEVILPRQPWK